MEVLFRLIMVKEFCANESFTKVCTTIHTNI